MGRSTRTLWVTSDVAIYSAADQAPSIGASGTALWEIRTASADRAALLELSFSGSFPTSTDRFGLGRPAAIGITPTTPVTWLAEDAGSPAGSVQSALAWGTGPTAPANFFRRMTVFGTFVVIWNFPRGLVIGVSSSLVLWTITLGTSAVVDLFGWVDE